MYNELYEGWHRETEEKEEIQPLPKDFYARVKAYMGRLKEELKTLDENSLRGRLIKQEDEKSTILLEELLVFRLGKILGLTLEERPLKTTNLTVEEEKIHLQITDAVKNMSNIKKDNFIVKEEPEKRAEEGQPMDRTVIRFIKKTSAMVGTNMKIYGPFEEEDVASIPLKNIEKLIQQGIGRRVNIS
ncbi:MAG: hypothetical protein ABIH76_02115 [Candidatus Bathyarchaeota archaeon]